MFKICLFISLVSFLLCGCSTSTNKPLVEITCSRVNLLNEDDVNHVNELIDSLPTINKTNYLNNKDALFLAYDAYNALTDDDKANVSSDRVTKLNDNVTMYYRCVDTDRVNELIGLLPSQIKFTYDNYKDYQDIVVELISIYDNALSAYIKSSNKTKYTSIKKKYDGFVTVDYLIESIDNLGDITIENYQEKLVIMYELKDMYSSLSSSNALLVTNYKTLVRKGALAESMPKYIAFIDDVSILPESNSYSKEEHIINHTKVVELKTLRSTFKEDEEQIVGTDSLTKCDAISLIDDDYTAVDSLVDKLHMSENNNGQCIIYYPEAREVYLTLTNAQKDILANEYHDETLRLNAWAFYHNENLDSGSITTNSQNRTLSMNSGDSSTMLIMIIAVSFLASICLGITSVLLNKRKHKK